MNISGYIGPILKVLDILKTYTKPGFRNTYWFNFYLLLTLRNDQSKSVSLILGHPVQRKYLFVSRKKNLNFLKINWKQAIDKKVSFIGQISQPIKESKKLSNTQDVPIYITFKMTETNSCRAILMEKIRQKLKSNLLKTLLNT